MSNLLFTKGLEQVQKNDLDWETDTIRMLLERDTSGYSPDIRDDYLDSFTSGAGIEITVASYARQTLANCTIILDDADDQVKYDCNNILFGNLESGQTVKALLVYLQVGGDDTTPANDVLLAYIDTVSGVLPAALGGGAFNITINSNGFIRVRQQ